MFVTFIFVFENSQNSSLYGPFLHDDDDDDDDDDGMVDQRKAL